MVCVHVSPASSYYYYYYYDLLRLLLPLLPLQSMWKDVDEKPEMYSPWKCPKCHQQLVTRDPPTTTTTTTTTTTPGGGGGGGGSSNDEAFTEHAQNEGYRICRKCKAVIYKEAGCDKMRCRCGYK